MSDELCFTPATELAAMIRRRELSARELLDAHLDRIEATNPKVNAIVTLDIEGARAQADAADLATSRGEPTGPLHGLPVAHKDTHVTGGMRTTWGSPLHRDFVPTEDELVVARLREAGAIRVGKTNVPEFAAGSHTFNTVFGATRNPYRLDVSAGGSSGGAAAALASGMVALAEGSDMGARCATPPRSVASSACGPPRGGYPATRRSSAGRPLACRDQWAAPSATSPSGSLRSPARTRGCRSRWTSMDRASRHPCHWS